MPVIGELKAIIETRMKALKAQMDGDAPLENPDISTWLASVAQLHTQFDGCLPPFSFRAPDMHWPESLAPSVLLFKDQDPEGVTRLLDPEGVTRLLQKWLHSLKKLQTRMKIFLEQEAPKRNVMQSLMAGNKLVWAKPLAVGGEDAGFHSVEAVLKHLDKMPPNKIMLKTFDQLEILLPGLLAANETWDMSRPCWLKNAQLVADFQTKDDGHGTLAGFVGRMLTDYPDKIRVIFMHAMKGEHHARTREALKPVKVEPVEGPVAGTFVGAVAVLKPMSAAY
jgi:hypothetical protein